MTKWLLRVWKVRRTLIKSVGDGKSARWMIRATCPHCGGSLLIGLSWRKGNKFKTASCPHCFKTSQIPKYRR